MDPKNTTTPALTKPALKLTRRAIRTLSERTDAQQLPQVTLTWTNCDTLGPVG
jgi:hypothetical protein